MPDVTNEEPSAFFKPPARPTLRFDDAVRFFKTISPDAKCVACNAKSWEIPMDDGDETLCFLQSSGMTRADEVVYNLNIECRKCGWVRSHRAGLIQKWVNKNPRAQTPDE